MFEIETAVNQLDNRRAQVLIQAAIVEVSGDDAAQLGVQWALGNANSGYGVVNFNNVGASAASLAGAVLSGGASGISSAAGSIAGALLGIGDSSTDSDGNTQFYGAILQALDSSTSANLLSMPSILTLDNEKASILVGQNVPFVTGSYTTSGNSSENPFQTIDRQDIGINLNVIPHIGDNGTVRLEVSQEVSSVVPGSVGNASGLITNKSLINTTILADDQQTIALGGLMRDNTTSNQQKVPGLGNVPIIGRLFRSDSDSTQKSNLIIFLQPTILRDGGAVASVTERKYNQMRVLQLVIDKNGTI
ncbi:type II secretion system secretin GspD, partial [Psychrobacter sp. 1U2]